jgi:hypothetical protein
MWPFLELQFSDAAMPPDVRKASGFPATLKPPSLRLCLEEREAQPQTTNRL